MHQLDPQELLKQLTGELDNFEDIARYLLPQPGEVPKVDGFDIHGGTLALNGRVGGDHIIYTDFKRRFDLEARIERAARSGRAAKIFDAIKDDLLGFGDPSDDISVVVIKRT